MNKNKILINLKFRKYEFRRVKLMGDNPVIYTTIDWVGKLVLIIPVPFNVTDRYIESTFDIDKEAYDITIESDTIIKKRVGKSKSIGRIYVPKDLIGLDCLVIESPILDNF